ncbi:MAG TPA: 3-deoxy-manno-octulosonate cytidylyltransferase [bacterium]|nr:3-deoxy-manno-octulosonate cytidylyltransferase [bacterium]
MNIIGVIPARLKSTRLKEKMLARVSGKTLVEHVYSNALKSKMIRKLYVATDSAAVKKVIEKAGGRAVMTPKTCGSGTERIREALKTIGGNINDIIVNIQGDEPLLEPANIDNAIRALIKERECDSSTLASRIGDEKEFKDPSTVKVVTDASGCAIYFSRAMIPFPRDGKNVNGAALKHIGLYAYRRHVLDRWLRMKSVYEPYEKLEQLRMVENGCRIKVVICKSRSMGIDTPKDLKRLKQLLK